MLPNLKLEDLKVGMEVQSSQLVNIFDIHIILKDVSFVGINEVSGVIAYIGRTLTDESDNIVKFNKTYGIYNDSSEFEGGYSYDD